MKLTDNERAFLDGLLEAYEDLPDGAWQVCCEEAISKCNEFKGRDANDVWLAWLEGTEG